MYINRIILHWTAGGYYPNATDLEHYHYLIDKDGNIHNGRFKVSDNYNCNDGIYAAHCGGGNTGAIGIALCGMAGYKNSKQPGKYFITKKQCETMFSLCAKLMREYSLSDTTLVKTHAEFGRENPKTSSYGKIDITALPPCYDIDVTKAIINANGNKIKGYGNFIRSKIKWYLAKRGV